MTEDEKAVCNEKCICEISSLLSLELEQLSHDLELVMIRLTTLMESRGAAFLWSRCHPAPRGARKKILSTIPHVGSAGLHDIPALYHWAARK